VQEKFSLANNDYKLVLEGDGASVDDNEILDVIVNDGIYILMVLSGSESWSAAAPILPTSSSVNKVSVTKLY
jgi:hypothetical protein